MISHFHGVAHLVHRYSMKILHSRGPLFALYKDKVAASFSRWNTKTRCRITLDISEEREYDDG